MSHSPWRYGVDGAIVVVLHGVAGPSECGLPTCPYHLHLHLHYYYQQKRDHDSNGRDGASGLMLTTHD